jgi:4-hydroxy-tetrahydrodipicolinate reductase
MKIILIGALGRMGQTVVEVGNNFSITQIGREGSFLPHDISPFLKESDLILDFSTEAALLQNLPKALLAKKPIVIGITGLRDKTLHEIKLASRKIPIFLSPNFSEGVSLLKKLIKNLPHGNYEITETHHTQKKDSPSGTALDLASKLPNYPSIKSIREGFVVGIHKITLNLGYEKLELTHEVFDRKAFAKGALLACTFLSNKPPGLYTSVYD